MADNIDITPGSGATVATDEVGGRHFQVVKPAFGADGNVTFVSEAAPLPTVAYGELVEALEAQRFALQALTRTIGQAMPDVAGRLRVAIDAISASLTLATITTVTTVTTVSTVSNQTNMGGLSATEQIPSLMRLGADSMRRNISVT
jgi:DNA integrity scanning protein DisA with diadenylate cyclase activity